MNTLYRQVPVFETTMSDIQGYLQDSASSLTTTLAGSGVDAIAVEAGEIMRLAEQVTETKTVIRVVNHVHAKKIYALSWPLKLTPIWGRILDLYLFVVYMIYHS